MRDRRLGRPAELVGTGVAFALVVAGPLWLFADALGTYRLHSDDFAYVAASRTFARTLGNLFVPHNTHIVPAWRLLTWAVVSLAGSLANLQQTLAIVSYGTLALTMLLLAHFVRRETGSLAIGLAAAVGFGTTAVVKSSATWYSAGQTLWASLGILATLTALQGWRRSGGVWRLLLAGASAWVAGGMWTVGHAAGPIGFIYLWADGRPRARKAAVVPLLATLLAVGVAAGLGASRIDAKISFHGRSSKQAVNLPMGVAHTLQAIPENLVLGNLGIVAETTLEQGILLSALIALAWGWSRVWSRRAGPMEYAGAALVVLSYFVEWSFRGYLPYSSLRGIVPWYDTIPQLGWVLLCAGWWSGLAKPDAPPRRPTLAGLAAVLAFELAMIVVQQPQVDVLFASGVPEMSETERLAFPTPELQRGRAVMLASRRAQWQHRHLKSLDDADLIARRLGIGREGIHRTFGRVKTPEIPDVYDAAAMLSIPWRGRENDPAVIRRALRDYFVMKEEPKITQDDLRGIMLNAAPRRRR